MNTAAASAYTVMRNGPSITFMRSTKSHTVAPSAQCSRCAQRNRGGARRARASREAAAAAPTRPPVGWMASFSFRALARFTTIGATVADPARLDKVIALARHRGFVFQAGEIYGGSRSAWDYGPLGTELKENIRRQWWRYMVTSRGDMVGLDSCIILPKRVWEASGHVASSPTRSSSACTATSASARTT